MAGQANPILAQGQAPAAPVAQLINYEPQSRLSNQALMDDVLAPRAGNAAPTVAPNGAQLPITTSLQYIAQQVAILNSPISLQALQLIAFASTFDAGTQQAIANFKTALATEITRQHTALNIAIPAHCAPITGAAPAAQGFEVAPENSNTAWLGLSNTNMIERNHRFETLSFPAFEKSMFLGLGGLPRMVVAIHNFVVALFYTILHAIPSLKASWDTSGIQNKAGVQYHAEYRNFYAREMKHAAENFGLSLILSLPVVGAFFAQDRDAKLVVAKQNAVNAAALPQAPALPRA